MRPHKAALIRPTTAQPPESPPPPPSQPRGDPLVCDNIATHPIFSSEIAAYRERDTDGFILIPLVEEGVTVACLCVTMSIPRTWSSAEVELVRKVGNRTWKAAQRIRAEAAIGKS